MNRSLIYIAATLSIVNCQLSIAQQPVPAPKQSAPITIVGATVHIGNGKLVENAIVKFDNGKIARIESWNGSEALNDANTINAKGKHLYPGFIALNSNLGLSEIEAVRATNDYNETGSVNPNIQSTISYNTDSKVTPTVRFNGVLLAQVTPQGGQLSGKSSVMMLDAWNWEDALYKNDVGVHLNWANMTPYKAWWIQQEENQQEKAEKEIQRLYAFFKEAKSYVESNSTEKNLRFEGMKALFNGSQKLFINANGIKEISASVAFCKEMGIKMVLVGGNDAWLATELLKENNIPVIVGRTHSLPNRTDEDVDLPYKLPYLLHKEGLQVALSVDGFWQQRNLPFNAGTAAAYGLSKEEALACITSNAASILGIDKTTGTIEVGKDANLFISTGDALDMRTNNVEQAYIQGRKIELSTVQTELYKKYLAKYNIK